MDMNRDNLLVRSLAVLRAAGGTVPLAALHGCVTEGPALDESPLSQEAFRGLLGADSRFQLNGNLVALAMNGANGKTLEGLSQEPVVEESVTLDSFIEHLDVCNRAKNQLPRNGVRTVRDLLSLSEDHILQLSNIGRKTTADILRERSRLLGLFGDQSNGASSNESPTGDICSPSFQGALEPELAKDETPLEELMLSFRPENVLRNHGYTTVGEVASLTEDALLSFRNLGDNSLREIRRRLKSLRNHRKAVAEGRTPDRPVFESADDEWSHAGISLSPRDRRIVEVRFGLLGGERPTLSEVSKMVGVTRERVRQIAGNGALLLGRLPLLVPRLIEEVVEERGGIAFVGDIAEQVKKRIPFSRLDAEGYCELLLTGTPSRFQRIPGTRTKGLWVLSRIGPLEFEGALEVAEELITSGSLLTRDALASVVHRSFFEDRTDLTPDSIVRPLVSLLHHVAETTDGRLYDRRWGAEGRCAAILRSAKGAMHFSEVAKTATEIFSDRGVSDRRALSCMVDSPLFCRVGDGRYSLRELGDEHVGHVRELIGRVLREADRPLHREEILERVAGMSPYQPGTITSGLYCSSDTIVSLKFSVFALRGRTYPDPNERIVRRIQDLLPEDGSMLVKSVLLELSRHCSAGEVKSVLARIPGIMIRGCGGSMSVSLCRDGFEVDDTHQGPSIGEDTPEFAG